MRISKDAPSATALHWSPDSRKVAFTTEQGARARIQIVNLDGTNYREPYPTESAITGMDREQSGFIWSKDSSAIWYIEQSQLIRLSTASGAQPQIIDQNVDLLVGRDRSGMIIYVQQRENASVMRRSRADGSATTDLFSMADPIIVARIAP